MTSRPLKQKTIGILGGGSNIATGEYYKLINDISNSKLGGWDIAETIIVGMNFGNIEYFVRTADWTGLEEYMTSKVAALVASQCDLILCVSNTLHKPLANIIKTVDIPFIHIADPTGAAICRAGLSKIILLGTKPIMNLEYMRHYYENQFGIQIIVPSESEQDDVNRIIFDELVKDQVLDKSKQRYLNIVDRLVQEEGAEGVILGCTEIFLLIKQEDRPELPVFNTTALHCEAAVNFTLDSN